MWSYPQVYHFVCSAFLLAHQTFLRSIPPSLGTSLRSFCSKVLLIVNSVFVHWKISLFFSCFKNISMLDKFQDQELFFSVFWIYFCCYLTSFIIFEKLADSYFFSVGIKHLCVLFSLSPSSLSFLSVFFENLILYLWI